MDTESNQTLKNFLENNGSGITKILGTNLITQFNGLQPLLSDYDSVKDIAIDSGNNTVIQLKELVNFYTENKAELLSLVAAMLDLTGYYSIVEFVSNIATEDSLYELDNDSCNMDDVAKALYVPLDENNEPNDCYQAVAAAVTWLAIEQFALAWEAEYEYH